MQEFFEPGDLVVNPAAGDWGLGQVQSVIGGRATVNFEHVGKVVIDLNTVALVHAPDPPGFPDPNTT